MSIAFHTAVSGMKAFQDKLDVVGHNMANVNTVGFKKQDAAFSDLLYTRINQHKNYLDGNDAKPEGGDGIDMVGHGVKIGSSKVIYSQNGFTTTDMPLDFAIEGEGLFGVDNNGKREYTRNGAFSLSINGKSANLVTNDGANVLDSKGRPIKLELDAQGTPIFDGLTEKLGVFSFSNPFGLQPASGSRFTETALSGTAKTANGAANKVRQFSLEMSSVNLGEEMVEMIQAQRAFQMNSKMVQSADEVDEMVNNLR